MSNEEMRKLNEQKPLYDAFLLTIGQPRLKPYKDFFRCSTSQELAGVYLWGQAVAAAFQPTLGMYEVVLRNGIHLQASRLSSKNTSDSCPWYDCTNTTALTIRGGTRERIDSILCNVKGMRLASQPAPDTVVAALSFGFWPNFLSGLNSGEQTVLLTKIFHAHPHSSPRHWGRSHNVRQLITSLKSIQNLRNAIAHYEPIWKRHRLTGIELDWTQSVQSLRLKHAEIMKVMAWCCPQSAEVVERSFATRILQNFCCENAVHAFKADPLGAGKLHPL